LVAFSGKISAGLERKKHKPVMMLNETERVRYRPKDDFSVKRGDFIEEEGLV
jgi:hypothetical protein